MSNYEKWMLLLAGILVMVIDVFIQQKTLLWVISFSCIMVALKLMWEGRNQ